MIRLHHRGVVCALVLCLIVLQSAMVVGPAAAQATDATATATVVATDAPPAAATLAPTTETLPAATTVPDPRFGVIESYEQPAMASRLGVGWTRVRFQWAETQPDGPDDWQPLVTDEQIDAEIAAGRMVVGLLIGVPDWARDRTGIPKGLNLPEDDPRNTWAVFVRDVVERYRGRIDHWIIWNEPDITDPDTPGHTWDGDIEDFARLQRVAYLTARDANPEAVIHLAAFTHFWDPEYFGRFLDVLLADPDAAANDYYFDVATAHLYFQPNSIYDLLTLFRTTMAERGIVRPIWLVETNAPPIDDPYWRVPNWTLSVTLNEQAAFVPQALASAMAAGAERIAVFKLMDTEQDREANPEPFGLVRFDTSRRPAYNTYQVAIRMLAGATGARRERWDEVGQIRVAQRGRATTVLFARLPAPQRAVVRAEAETAELVDMWGGRKTLTARNGRFVIDLQAALCTQPIGDYCMIGGTTVYLVQEISAAARPERLPEEDALAATRSAQTDAPAMPTTTPEPEAASTRDAMPTRDTTPTATTSPVATVAAQVVRLPTVTLQASTPQAPTLEASAPATEPTAAPSAQSKTPPDQQASGGGLADYAGLFVLGLAAMVIGYWLVNRSRRR